MKCPRGVDTRLVTPFLERARRRFHMAARARLAARCADRTHLALRVAEVPMGPDARDEVPRAERPDVRAATD